MVIWPHVIFVTSNFNILQAIPDNIIDAIKTRFTPYQFGNISGFKVKKRNEDPARHHVFRVLQVHKPDMFLRAGDLLLGDASMLMLKKAAFGTPEILAIIKFYNNTQQQLMFGQRFFILIINICFLSNSEYFVINITR